MRLSHFSDRVFKFDPDKKYKTSDCEGMKPKGFWLSDETEHGWKKWCKAEEFRLNHLKVETIFECDLSSWRVIKSAPELLQFGEEFKSTDLPRINIDWNKVKKQFSGILISPYLWECRLEAQCFWYYIWDCASACVWDLSTIKEIK